MFLVPRAAFSNECHLHCLSTTLSLLLNVKQRIPNGLISANIVQNVMRLTSGSHLLFNVSYCLNNSWMDHHGIWCKLMTLTMSCGCSLSWTLIVAMLTLGKMFNMICIMLTSWYQHSSPQFSSSFPMKCIKMFNVFNWAYIWYSVITVGMSTKFNTFIGTIRIPTVSVDSHHSTMNVSVAAWSISKHSRQRGLRYGSVFQNTMQTTLAAILDC